MRRWKIKYSKIPILQIINKKNTCKPDLLKPNDYKNELEIKLSAIVKMDIDDNF
jgi:hypothetical protein